MPRRSLRTVQRAPQRRKRVWARNITSGTTGAATQTHVDLLTNFQSVAGIASPPPGVTVGGIRIAVVVRATAASPNNFTLDKEVTWGILIGDPGSDIGDIVPSAASGMHRDWLWWENRQWNHTAGEFDNTQHFNRQVKSMRRMDEIGMNLTWVIDSVGSGESINFGVSSSVLLIMP